MTGSTTAGPLTSRNPGLRFGPDEAPWQRRLPEFASAVEAVSLIMPHAEPYVVDAAERVLDDLPPDLRGQTRGYIRQERSHHAQHRRFNDAVIGVPGDRVGRWLAGLDRAMAATFRFLSRRSARFGIAFAAGFETIAFAGARWVEPRIGRLFGAADDDGARLFLWHLAEEVEHKGVAHDAWIAADGRRSRYLLAMWTAALLLAVFSFAGTMLLLVRRRRWWSPLAHARLAWWSLTFVFEAVTLMMVSALPGHHPDQLADPGYLKAWLWDLDADR
ncbi:MAG: metal-dependent hydrolase [Actinomycetota bacterium]